MAKDINIGGRLHSIATGNVIAGADEILDDNLGKKQTQINTETYSLVESVNNALDALNPDQQEALAVAAKANANEAKLGYYVCDTDADVAAKTVVATNYVLGTGGSIKVKMTNANTVNNAKLNINSTGAKPLFYEGVRASSTNTWAADDVLEIYYDGTNYQAKNVSPAFKTGEKVNSLEIDDEPTAGSKNLVESGGTFAQYFNFIYRVPESSSDWIPGKVYYNASTKKLRLRKENSWETIDFHKNIIYCRENAFGQNVPILYKYDETENGLLVYPYNLLLLNKVNVPSSSSDWKIGMYYNPSSNKIRYYNGSYWSDFDLPKIGVVYYSLEDEVLYYYDSTNEKLVNFLDRAIYKNLIVLNNIRIPSTSSQWTIGYYYNKNLHLIRKYDGSSWSTYDNARQNCLYLCLADGRIYKYNVSEQIMEPIINYHVLDSYTNDRYVIMERGTINDSGNNINSTTRMRLVDYFPINEDVSIQCTFASVGLRYYDVNKDFIGSLYTDTAKYLRFFLYDGSMAEQTANNEFLKNKSIVIGGLVYKFREYKSLIEETDSYVDSTWKGKTILWFGTSIPNGKYPQIVGDLLDARIINNSVGASVITCGYRDGKTPIMINQQLAFSATKAEKEANFGTSDYNKYSYEERLIPYLDGTYDAPDAIVLEYGSDWNRCKTDADRENFPKLNEDASDVNVLPVDSLTQSLGVNFNRFTYTGAMLFIINTILSYKPFMRIYIVGYLNNMRRPGNDPAMRTIANYWQIPYCNISDMLGWSDRVIPGSMVLFNNKYSPTYEVESDVTQFRMWCPDDWHPHTNGTRLSNGYKESNYFLATKVAKWLNEVF